MTGLETKMITRDLKTISKCLRELSKSGSDKANYFQTILTTTLILQEMHMEITCKINSIEGKLILVWLIKEMWIVVEIS